MLVSLNWLKDFVDIKMDPKNLATELTLKTAEVEGMIAESSQFENMVVGFVETMIPHPNADKLRIAKVSIGKETLQIVCGGENLKEGMYVAVAKIGAKVKWHGEGELITMERAKIRGEESFGMICAGEEIGIDDPSAGPKDILDLSSLKPEIGMPLADLFGKNDTILEFDNKALTNRPDLWGHYGIAREVAALTDSKFKTLEPKVKIPTSGESVKVEVKNNELCPRYCGLIIKNIKVAASPDWLKKRLKATGHGIHNNIVDVTNYVMNELGQPLHAFDKNYIKGGIVVRTAQKNEKIKALDEKEHDLSVEMLVIADHEKPVAIAGIIGGENSGINENTTEIIIESANFHPGNVRKTSTKLGIRTDSVQRFEKSLDPNLAELAIKRAAELILELCPDAKISGPITDVKNFGEKPLKISLDIKKAQSKIGIEISPKEIKSILESLEFKVAICHSRAGGNSNLFEVEIPSFRSSKDVTIEDDLIEEIARIYGYENIPTILPNLPSKLPLENTERFKKHRTRELFSYALGFDEVYNYSFYGLKELKNCAVNEDGHIKLLNYLSEDQTHLRTTLIPNLLKNFQLNAKYFDSVKLYEIGRTYKEIGQFMPLEEKNIGGGILVKGKSDTPFYEAKGATEAFFKKFNITTKQTKGIENTPYAHPVKSLSFLGNNGKTLAKAFILHPEISKNHDLEKYSIAMFEINFSKALEMGNEEKSYKQIPKFPPIEIDISVLIDKEIEVEKIKNAIMESEKTLITSTELFDIYEGPNIEKAKKAIAYKVTLQAQTRTLTDEDMTQAQQKIFKALEALGGTIRGK
ncbi:MAG: phenylalanine--tRNA ligase subunit beta [Candidatus Gracilibacteria bacterium]|nr:phenylalanine--tRNA ligase subunit beta [Candidatus Gracilibacteria bacterium]